jgi:hypothetical protein
VGGQCPANKRPRDLWQGIEAHTEGACCECEELDSFVHASCVRLDDTRIDVENQCTAVMRYMSCAPELDCVANYTHRVSACEDCAEAVPYRTYMESSQASGDGVEACMASEACDYRYHLSTCHEIVGRCVGNHDSKVEPDIVCSGTGSTLKPNAASISSREPSECCMQPCACVAKGGFKGLRFSLNSDITLSLEVRAIFPWICVVLVLQCVGLWQLHTIHTYPATGIQACIQAKAAVVRRPSVGGGVPKKLDFQAS